MFALAKPIRLCRSAEPNMSESQDAASESMSGGRMPKKDEFVGRVALVTGGAGAAIGSATCRVLASYGAAVVVLDNHERRTLQTAAALREEYGVPALGVVADIADRAAVDRVLDE